jgi:hypothetical protein
MSLFIVTDKKTKKNHGVYQVRTEEDLNMKDVTGSPWVNTLFLIYRDDRWEWVHSRDFEPLDLDGMFNE